MKKISLHWGINYHFCHRKHFECCQKILIQIWDHLLEIHDILYEVACIFRLEKY